jgi:hypothetical protein
MNRPVGVSIPQGQNHVADAHPTKGTPRQLLSIAKLETYGIQYTDEAGNVHTALCHRMGDTVYIHPNDEQWASGIRTAAAWLAQSVNDKVKLHEAAAKAAAAPDKPMVDVAPPKLG